jgi:hypothetical protein
VSSRDRNNTPTSKNQPIADSHRISIPAPKADGFGQASEKTCQKPGFSIIANAVPKTVVLEQHQFYYETGIPITDKL